MGSVVTFNSHVNDELRVSHASKFFSICMNIFDNKLSVGSIKTNIELEYHSNQQVLYLLQFKFISIYNQIINL